MQLRVALEECPKQGKVTIRKSCLCVLQEYCNSQQAEWITCHSKHARYSTDRFAGVAWGWQWQAAGLRAALPMTPHRKEGKDARKLGFLTRITHGSIPCHNGTLPATRVSPLKEHSWPAQDAERRFVPLVSQRTSCQLRWQRAQPTEAQRQDSLNRSRIKAALPALPKGLWLSSHISLILCPSVIVFISAQSCEAPLNPLGHGFFHFRSAEIVPAGTISASEHRLASDGTKRENK